MYSARDIQLEISKAGYSLGRNVFSAINAASRKVAGQPNDYETVVRLGELLVRNTPDFLWSYQVPKELKTDFMGLEFKSPLAIAAFKGDYAVLEKWGKLGASAITKTIMPFKQPGNRRPRHVTFKDANGAESHINAYGLPSKGVEKEIVLLVDSGLLKSDNPIGINFGGENTSEYLRVFEKLHESREILEAIEDNKLFFQPNIGCPNVKTGQNMCKLPGEFGSLMESLEEINSTTPYLIKTPPYLTGMAAGDSTKKILDIAEICASYDNVGMTLANTIPVDTIYTENDMAASACFGLSTKRGGYSGLDCLPRALELTEMVVSKYGLPVSLCGGIHCAEDVLRGKDASATFFEIATAVGKNPFRAIAETNIDLAKLL